MIAERVRRTGVVAVASIAAAVVVLVAVVVVDGDEHEPVEQAQQLLRDRDRFETSIQAAETFAQVGQHLNEAVGECRSRSAPTTRCEALSAASGYVQVLAAVVLRCTAPGRFEARIRAARFLEDAERVLRTSADLPDPPPLPDC